MHPHANKRPFRLSMSLAHGRSDTPKRTEAQQLFPGQIENEHRTKMTRSGSFCRLASACRRTNSGPRSPKFYKIKICPVNPKIEQTKVPTELKFIAKLCQVKNPLFTTPGEDPDANL